MSESRKVSVGTCVVVLKQIDGVDHVLLLRRKGSHGAGTWSVPGGWIDWGETDTKASALRELREEVGDNLKTTEAWYLGITNDVFTDEDMHCLTLWYIADYVSGEPQLMEPDKADQLGWFTGRELPENLFLPFLNYLKGKIIE